MKKEEWEQSLHSPTRDGRTYQKIEDSADLLDYKDCLVRYKRVDGYGGVKYLPGGILHHVDPELRYLYLRIPGTPTTFCLQIPLCEFWVLPQS